MDAPDGKSAINRYDLNEHHVLNSHKENRTDYDLLSIITIYLGIAMPMMPDDKPLCVPVCRAVLARMDWMKI